jgi:hypothetical protein
MDRGIYTIRRPGLWWIVPLADRDLHRVAVGIVDLQTVGLELMRREHSLYVGSHAGHPRMCAGLEHRQRVGPLAVGAERCRRVRARIQQPGGDLRGVGRDDLPTNLDPVSGRVVQERGVVAVGRPTLDQIRGIGQEAIQLLDPTEHDGIHGELEDRIALAFHPRPRREAMITGDDQAGVLSRQGRASRPSGLRSPAGSAEPVVDEYVGSRLAGGVRGAQRLSERRKLGGDSRPRGRATLIP